MQTASFLCLVLNSSLKHCHCKRIGSYLRIWFIFKKHSFTYLILDGFLGSFKAMLGPKFLKTFVYGQNLIVQFLGNGKNQALGFYLHFFDFLRFFSFCWTKFNFGCHFPQL